MVYSLFFFNDTATTEIYTLSLHDALPISTRRSTPGGRPRAAASSSCGSSRRQRRPSRGRAGGPRPQGGGPDRKSTRLNSSHANISYAVFCLKKKKITHNIILHT